MAGGGSELEASLLETPTFVLSVVFFVFLALSFSFELVVHFTHTFFIRRGRHGMADAVQKIVMELTLLGFVSLLLTAFSKPLGRMCVDWSDAMADWTLESNIRGCPCCLATTQGVSLCTQARGKAAARRTGLPAVPAHYRLLGHGQGTSDRGSILKRWQRVVLPPGSTEQCGQCGHAHPAAAGCLQMDHDCLWNVSSRKPYCDCSVTGTADYAAAGYEAYPPSSQLHKECKPYKLSEAQFFVDVSVASLRTISDTLNISVTDVCAALASGARLEVEAGSIDPSMLGEWESWEEFVDDSGDNRRRLLRSSSMAGRTAGGGCAGRRASSRRLLAGGSGGAGEGGVNPLQVLLAQDPTAPTQRHLLPRISLFKCTGPFMSSSCPDGQVPLISQNALHQMHIYLFLVAIFHVAVSVVQILLGRVRLRLWRRWERQAQQAGAAAAPPPAPPLGRVHSSTGRGSSKECSHAENGAAGTAADDAHDSGGAPASAQGAGTDVEAAAAVAAANKVGAGSSRDGSLRFWAPLSPLWGRVRRRWQVRNPRMPSAWHCLAEAGICFVQALSPDTVTKQNFLLMRAAWLASQPAAPADMAQLGTVDKEKEVEHGSAKGGREEQSEPSPQQPEQQPQQQHQGHQQLPAASKGAGGKGADAVSTGCGGCGGAVLWRFQCRQAGGQAGFVDHMLGCLEDDLPSFVGLSVEMGVVACVMLLLAGVTGWIGPLFLIVASALLLAINMILVALLRNSCRGGEPHSSAQRPVRWWRNPHLLLAIPIRLILFLCSFVYSSIVLFAWQFGSDSCFFSKEGDVWGVGGLPWWTGVMWVAVLLLWVGLVTIPTFSLVVHPHRAKRAAAAALGRHPSHHSGGETHAAHSHNISMLLDAAMSRGSGGSDAAPTASSLQVPGSQAAAVRSGDLALAGIGGSSMSGSLQDAPCLEAELLAEISRLRARVAQLEASQPSCVANGAGSDSKADSRPPAGSEKDAGDSCMDHQS